MELNENLVKFIQVSKDMENCNLFSDTASLSRTEFRLLREVIIEQEKGKKIISSELSRRLGVTRSAISQIVTKLEKRGIVQRTDAENDRKIAYIQLSDNALTLFEQQCSQANEIAEKVEKKLGPEKLNKLLELYDEFAKVLNESRKEIRGDESKKK